MKTFSQYLNESNLENYLRAGKVDRYRNLLGQLSAAEKSGQIYNARYKDLKSGLVNVLNDILQDQWSQHRDVFRDMYDLPMGMMSTATIKKELRDTIEIAKKYPHNAPLQERVSLYKSAAEIIARVVALKDKVLAGREKIVDPNVAPKFKPILTPDVIKPTEKVIRNMVDSHREKFANNMAATMAKEIQDNVLNAGYTAGSIYTNYQAKKKQVLLTMKERKILANKMRFYPLQRITTLFNPDDTLRKNWKEFVAKDASEITDTIFDKFIYKNATKLAAIFGRKGMPKKIHNAYVRVAGMSLENEAGYEMQDGSAFTVSNSIVYGYRQGRTYVQYPTRFHAVIKADGTKMKSPSEEKMNLEF